MNIFDIPLVAAVLGAASALLGALGSALTPAVAVVVLTLVVRALLLPAGASVVRAEGHRRRLAPKLAALQKRFAKNPERLQRETLALYSSEKVSPFAGLLPALAQAPVLMVVYGVFTQPRIAGAANPLFDATLVGAPLGRHLSEVTQTGFAPTDLVSVALLVVIGIVAWLSRRSALALGTQPAGATTTEAPGSTTASAAAATASIGRVLSWLPFLTVLFAAIVPLAATLYLAVSTAWTLAERTVLRRMLWPRLGVALPGRAALPPAAETAG